METLRELLASFPSPILVGSAVLGLTTVGYAIVKANSGPPKGSIYPPGPPQDPIIGSYRAFPKDELYPTFNKWQKLYGDIVYLQFPGMAMFVINSYDMAHELLSKRASSNSGRIIPYMIRELMGWSWSLAFLDSGDTHQRMRKMFRRGIGPQRVAGHNDLVEANASKLVIELQGLKGNPTDIVMNAVGRNIIQVAYGKQIWETYGSDLVKYNKELGVLLFSTFGKIWAVDIMPFLRFVPSWMPGAEFRRRGLRSTWLTDQIRWRPFERAVKLFDSKQLDHSMASDLFDEFGQTAEVRDTLGVLYFAGTESTSSAVVHFLQCMFVFPEVASKVQKEIEDTVGSDRLPTIADTAHLPYCEAVWKETIRWNTSLPIAIPHVNHRDEIINGYFIPKGSLINPNIGFMLNDPKIWGDPETFRPERHLEQQDRDDESRPTPSVVFGFGMRLCPGRELADRVGFHFATSIMAMYNVLPLEGKSLPDPNKLEYTKTSLRWPVEFDCRLAPRNERTASLLSTMTISGAH